MREFMRQYYHLFANGDDARDFITSVDDFKMAFNRVAVCAAKYPNLKVLAFSIEESHPHFLVFCTFEECVEFKCLYESLTLSYIAATRGSRDGVVFELEILSIDSDDYLFNVASYVIVQPTKDGKTVMPYDYRWGTGSMYFRPEGLPPIWCFNEKWAICHSVEYGSLTYRERRAMTHTTKEVPSGWLVCNGLILPTNYIEVGMYESIFRTFNCFRTFMSAGKLKLQPVIDRMAITRGIGMQDIEARRLAQSISEQLFGKKDSRWLTQMQRLQLAKELRSNYQLTFRQVATLTRLPEIEIRKYIK